MTHFIATIVHKQYNRIHFLIQAFDYSLCILYLELQQWSQKFSAAMVTGFRLHGWLQFFLFTKM
jgi:hypothetical protein